VYGATIGGGGWQYNLNTVTDDWGTVGGGSNNTATNLATVGGGENNTAGGRYATVGGGQGNTASTNSWATVGGGDTNAAGHSYATVGGGDGNTASGAAATVGGGQDNTASTNRWATVGGGYSNTASGEAATVGGGDTNAAEGWYATVGGGEDNAATYDHATVSGGKQNTTGGYYATVGGGWKNNADELYATVPGGRDAVASHYGEMAYASGDFGAAGDAQASLYVLRNETSDATETELFLDGNDDRLTVASGRTLTFDIMVAARSDGGDSAGYRAEGVIDNDGGTMTLIASTLTELEGAEADWTVTVEADDTFDALVIKVTGAASTNIRWVATVRTAEVAW
jgi:hypothetical protein